MLLREEAKMLPKKAQRRVVRCKIIKITQLRSKGLFCQLSRDFLVVGKSSHRLPFVRGPELTVHDML